MLDVNTKRKAILVMALIVVVFGTAAAFVAWGVDAASVATAAVG